MLSFHAAVLGWLNIDPLRALHAGLALVVMIECVIAGRVIPAFTMSALPGRQLKVPAWLERSTLAATALSLAAWVLLPANPVTAAGFALAALLHAARLWHWQPLRTRARPILWVLHAAYAWLPVGFLLLAWAQVGGVAASAGIHALAVGATAGLIVGMVTRTARGHTGRPLKVSRLEVAAYLLVAGRCRRPCAAPLGRAGTHGRLARGGCSRLGRGFRALPLGLHALAAEQSSRRQGRLNVPVPSSHFHRACRAARCALHS